MQVQLDALWLQVVESIEDAVLIVLPDCQIVHANPAYLALLGYNYHELIGCNLRDHRAFTELQPVARAIGRILSGEVPQAIEQRIRQSDGLDLAASVRMAPLRAPTGRVAAVAIFVRSVEIVHDLDLKSRLLTSIVESCHDAIVAKNLDGMITSWNTAAVDLFGYSAAEAIGQSITMLFPIECIAEESEIMARIRRGERVRHYEARRLAKDGSTLDLSITVSPVLNAGGEVIGASKIAHDVREERQRNDRLVVLASVFENCGEAIMILNAHGQFVDVNSSFSAITGYHHDEIIGRSFNAFRSGRQSPQEARRMMRELRRNRQCKGEIWTRRKDGSALAGFLTITALPGPAREDRYIAILADVTSLRLQQEKLEKLAHFDDLTGLPNRLLLHERLDQALAQATAQSSEVTVAYLDIDGFKAVNDRHGHDTGDEVLCHLAQKISDCLRPTDTAARIGGDEFVLILPQTRGSRRHDEILTDVLRRIRQPIRRGGLDIRVSASVGVTTHPQDVGGAEQLLRLADQAMYEAKRDGGDQIRHFDGARQAREIQLRGLVSEIETALAEDQFELHFQPKVDLTQGKVIGVEGLLRWMHPTLGLRMPGDFLPAIIEHPIIEDIGAFVIRRAFEAINHLALVGMAMPVSINVSARELRRGNFAAFVMREAARANVDDLSMLQLELPEATALDDQPEIMKTIAQCHDFGIGLAIDDFGVGFASLAYLARIPADTIKLDRSLVQNIDRDDGNRKIVIAVLAMAEAFGKSVVAEGVENELSARTLLAIGCGIIQGFAVTPALPMKRLIIWTRQWQDRVGVSPLPFMEAGLLFSLQQD